MKTSSFRLYHDKAVVAKSKRLYEARESCIDAHAQQIKYPNIFGMDS